jgi:hypothetical protein
VGLAVRALPYGARDLLQWGRLASLRFQLQEPAEYRDVVRVMRGLPRKGRLKAHPDWWCFQSNY